MKIRLLLFPVLTAWMFLAPAPSSAAPCAPGYFSVDGQDPCTPCSAGTFSDSSGSTGCTECAPHTSSVEASDSCEDCPFQYYRPEAGSASCVRRNDWSCWTAKDLKNPAAFTPVDDLAVSDEISSEPVRLLKPSVTCGSAGIASRPPKGYPQARLCCYKAKGPRLESPVSVEVTSQLAGTIQLGLKKRALVCDQCQEAIETEHSLQCWKVRDLKNPRFTALHDLRVSDEYSFDFLVVKKPALFCSPASVDGSPLTDPNGQQCCYRAGKAFRSTATESVTDPFGNPLEFRVVRRSMLCEPCTASLLP